VVARHSGRKLKFSNSLADAVAASQVIFIAVGTPSGENGEADLSYVESSAREVAHYIRDYTMGSSRPYWSTRHQNSRPQG
jgi:UDPglucose 6-dehydrogenase